MPLSISNIAWEKEEDELVYSVMQKIGYKTIEIAPSRIFETAPYSRLDDAKNWARMLLEQYGLTVSSMQSIWYGRQERLFGTKEERAILIDYTKRAIDFAHAIGCKNLVFGCPKNRKRGGEEIQYAIDFFHTVAEYATGEEAVIALEANPAVYGTDFINTTEEAISLVKEIGQKGLAVNLDIGAMLSNKEGISVIEGNTALISHVHISEEGLFPIQKREVHSEIAHLLYKEGYSKAVSIEMKKGCSIDTIKEIMEYVKVIFTR